MTSASIEFVDYSGSYKNKTFANAVVWFVLLLHIARYFWEHFIDVCFNHIEIMDYYHFFLQSIIKKIYYKEFVRVRLKKALWHFFFNVGFIFYLRLGVQGIFPAKDLLQNTSSTNDEFIFYVILSSFYIDSCIWEALEGSKVALSYALFSALTYLGQVLANFVLDIKSD